MRRAAVRRVNWHRDSRRVRTNAMLGGTISRRQSQMVRIYSLMFFHAATIDCVSTSISVGDVNATADSFQEVFEESSTQIDLSVL